MNNPHKPPTNPQLHEAWQQARVVQDVLEEHGVKSRLKIHSGCIWLDVYSKEKYLPYLEEDLRMYLVFYKNHAYFVPRSLHRQFTAMSY